MSLRVVEAKARARSRRSDYNRARGWMEGPPGTYVWPPGWREQRGVRLHGGHLPALGREDVGCEYTLALAAALRAAREGK